MCVFCTIRLSKEVIVLPYFHNFTNVRYLFYFVGEGKRRDDTFFEKRRDIKNGREKLKKFLSGK